MNMKIGKLKFIAMVMIAALTVAFVACKDDFSEEDYLRLQNELALRQDSITRARNQSVRDSAELSVVNSFIAAQNAAGNLMGVSLIVREDNTPVAGVLVTISSGAPSSIATGRTEAQLTGTSDASGRVDFDAVTIANSIITIVKELQ